MRLLNSAILILASIGLLSSASAKVGDQSSETPKSTEQTPAVLETQPLEINATNEIFRKHIENPAVHDAFRSMQWQLLNMSSDSALTNYFQYGHPILTSLYNALLREHDLEVQGFSMMAQTNMIKVSNGLTTRYNRLTQMINEVASDLGFSQEAIKNLELYIMSGEVNAFTVSGNDKRIIVVVQSELMEKLEDVEIRAVIAHELGHIRSLHSLQRQMNQYMINLLATALSKTGLAPDSAAVNAIDFAALDSQNFILESEHNTTAKNPLVEMSARHNLSAKNVQDRSRQIFTSTLKQINSLPPQDQTYLLSAYIMQLLNATVEMNANPDAIQYFSDLYNTIHNLGTIRVSLEQFAEYAQDALAAVSRSDESSADQYASAGNPNENIASAFGKLLGLVFERQNRSDLFKLVQKQAEDFESRYNRAERSPYMGSTHPALILRINNILKMPAYPAVLFANRFLKLLVLDSAIQQRLGQNSEITDVYATNLAKMNTYLSQSGDHVEESLPMISGQIKAVENEMKRSVEETDTLRAQHALLTKDIVESVVRLGLGAKMNPRFSNIIEHFSYLRETELNKILAIKVRLKNQNLSKENKSLIHKQILSIISALKEPSEILVGINNALTEEMANTKPTGETKEKFIRLEARQNALNALMTTKSVAELEKLRADFVPQREAGSVAERRRIPKETGAKKVTSQVCAKLLKS